MKVFQKILIVLLAFSLSVPTGAKASPTEEVKINLDHLDFLNEEVTIDGKDMLITHIYSEYPEYNWVDASGEGIACVDDVARAAIVYLNHYEQTGNKESLDKAKKALNFVMYMQAEDGEFYNFINHDFSINTDGSTSKKSFDWWAARGMWALGHGYRVFSKVDQTYAKELEKSFLLANDALQRKVNKSYGQYHEVHGYKIPSWISGFDAMSNSLLGLAEFYQAKPLPVIKDSMLKVGRGLEEYQFGTYDQYPFGAHLDWEGSPTLWHAWGSGQAFALAKAGAVLKKKEWIDSAKKEADEWFSHLLVTGMIKEMAPTASNDEQIAYGVSMLTQAYAELYKATHQKKYAQYAGITASWFTGNNDAKFVMYDSNTGRGYDGLNGQTGKVNMNSGAESTIESLLAIQAIQLIPQAKSLLQVKTTDRHTTSVYEAENFTTLEGNPEIITPASAWTGDALYSGKVVKLSKNDSIQLEVETKKPGEYLVNAALERKNSDEAINLEVRVDGRLISSTLVSDSPDTDYLSLVKLSDPIQLTTGKHKVTLTLKSNSSEALLVDNVVLQPVEEYATFVKENDETFKLERNLVKGKNKLKF
ncbi:hypothetical protein MUG84_22670 [Paenibacillus sp. KQZ6P-2]|uniref:Glycosyl hydrolase n=1 Tax=Paenibacillus mangrovi TaxID=2931978 RepID=A0A9X2B8I1_9BACL|nr:hypothetical protein [Paenibacillus mangrovi]MCJ8014508.1 hypothetical protein [Paenibacillus mangrovi]